MAARARRGGRYGRCVTATALAAGRARAWPRVLAAAVALWGVFDALILFGTFPYWPRTAARWALLLAGGPAMVLALAGLLELGVAPWIRRWSGRGPSRSLAAALAAGAIGAAVLALGAWWTLRVEGP
jgi:hypothetical protein